MRWLVALVAALAATAARGEPAPPLRLRADLLTWGRGTGRVLAEGHVRVSWDRLSLEAPLVRVSLPDRRIEARDARLLLRGPEGRLALSVTAQWVRGRVGGTYEAEGLTVTPCDCREGPPSWSFTAAGARVDPGHGAWLYWPVFRVLGVPLLPLPVFYVPVGARRSGLLAPEITLAGSRGPGLGLPLYLALGPSWDVTLVPRYHLGATPQSAQGVPLRPGVAGPGEIGRSFVHDPEEQKTFSEDDIPTEIRELMKHDD